jgi:hypothetical protein
MRAILVRWFRPSTFVVGVLATLLVAAAAHPMPGRYRFVAEGTVYLLLILTCASWAPLRRIAGQLGWPRLAVLGLVFLVATGVQLRKWYGPLYPFVPWMMYGSANPAPGFARYDVTLASGRTMELPLADLAPGTSNRAVLSHFNRELRNLREIPPDPEQVDENLLGLKRLLTDVALVYNERYPADPIRSVLASGCLIPIRAYDGLESIDCSPLLSFSLPEEVRP